MIVNQRPIGQTMELFFNYCEERKCFSARSKVDFGPEEMVLQLRPRMAVAIFSTLGSDPSGRQSRFSALTGSYGRGARLISLPGSPVPTHAAATPVCHAT